MTEIKIAGYLQGYLPKTAAKKTPEDEERRVQAALNVLHRAGYDAPSAEIYHDAGGVSLEELEELARAWKNGQLPELRRERYPRRAGAYGEEDGVPISYEEILRESKDYYINLDDDVTKKKRAIGKTAAKKTTLKELLGMGGDPPEGMTQEGWPLLPAVRPVYTPLAERREPWPGPATAEELRGTEDDNVIYMPDGRTEWEGDSLEETPYATAEPLYNEETGETSHGLPEGYEYLATDAYGDPLLRDPEGNLVTMFHENGDLRKVKTQLKIGPRKKGSRPWIGE